MGKKGQIPWNKGKTKETDSRILAQSKRQTGKKLSDEHKKSLSRARLGKEPWNKGLTKEDPRVKKYVDASAAYMKEKGKNPENHWNYQGGISNEEYGSEWTNELKAAIRDRDDFCVICGIEREEYRMERSEDLLVHHIDGNKQNNNKENLVCLCRKCHAYVHNSMKDLPYLTGM